MIQDAIRRGRRIFDFLQGDEVYKYRFGATDTIVMHTSISRSPVLS
jgi:CelD/BcsL family acetyltransferase involved in cellulose biosynthesis